MNGFYNHLMIKDTEGQGNWNVVNHIKTLGLAASQTFFGNSMASLRNVPLKQAGITNKDGTISRTGLKKLMNGDIDEEVVALIHQAMEGSAVIGSDTRDKTSVSVDANHLRNAAITNTSHWNHLNSLQNVGQGLIESINRLLKNQGFVTDAFIALESGKAAKSKNGVRLEGITQYKLDGQYPVEQLTNAQKSLLSAAKTIVTQANKVIALANGVNAAYYVGRGHFKKLEGTSLDDAANSLVRGMSAFFGCLHESSVVIAAAEAGIKGLEFIGTLNRQLADPASFKEVYRLFSLDENSKKDEKTYKQIIKEIAASTQKNANTSGKGDPYCGAVAGAELISGSFGIQLKYHDVYNHKRGLDTIINAGSINSTWSHMFNQAVPLGVSMEGTNLSPYQAAAQLLSGLGYSETRTAMIAMKGNKLDLESKVKTSTSGIYSKFRKIRDEVLFVNSIDAILGKNMITNSNLLFVVNNTIYSSYQLVYLVLMNYTAQQFFTEALGSPRNLIVRDDNVAFNIQRANFQPSVMDKEKRSSGVNADLESTYFNQHVSARVRLNLTKLIGAGLIGH